MVIDSNNLNEMLCVWEFSKLKNRLYEKHPKTLWVIADERIINGKTYFKYEKLTLTEKPIFSSFISLVSSSEITLDWTHRCLQKKNIMITASYSKSQLNLEKIIYYKSRYCSIEFS